jgi:hypothetical protein
MSGRPLILADANRAEEFLLLGRSRRLWEGFRIHTNADGTVWATTGRDSHVFAVTWLGPGWVFETAAPERWAQELKERQDAMRTASPEQHQDELRAIIARLRLGIIAERVLWLGHQQVLRLRTSLLVLPDFLLAEAIWGSVCSWPAHWRQEILAILKGLCWIHVTKGPIQDSTQLGTDTVLITHATDLRHTPQDACGNGCDGQPDGHHHHYLINIGRGFLGVLEDFAQAEDASGVRTYAFPVSGRSRRQSTTLRKVGRSGQLVSIYLPAKLGERSVCDALTTSQHRLLQALVRETTRNPGPERQSVSEAQIIQGNLVPTTNGKAAFPCDLLDARAAYVGFNGNKVLKGRGYRLLTPGGWLAKAGYSGDDIAAFFLDLAALADRLALIPVGVEPGTHSCLTLNQMSGLVGTGHGLTRLGRLHLRVYAPSDYLARWNAFFGWEEQVCQATETNAALAIAVAIQKQGISQKQLAQGMGVDASLLSKVLRGKKGWPPSWSD